MHAAQWQLLGASRGAAGAHGSQQCDAGNNNMVVVVDPTGWASVVPRGGGTAEHPGREAPSPGSALAWLWWMLDIDPVQTAQNLAQSLPHLMQLLAFSALLYRLLRGVRWRRMLMASLMDGLGVAGDVASKGEESKKQASGKKGSGSALRQLPPARQLRRRMSTGRLRGGPKGQGLVG